MRVICCFVVSAIIVLAGCSSSTGPGTDELENKFKLGLPSIWNLTDFDVTAEENMGNKTQPDIRSRFVAKVELARDIFEVRDELLGKTVVAKVKSKGEVEVELHGIARSQRNGGTWSVTFDLENRQAIKVPGKPLSDFSEYVLAGSAEEEALREEVARKKAEAERIRAEEERAAQRRIAALEQATGELLKVGAKLSARSTDSKSGESNAAMFSIESMNLATRTFSGQFHEDSKSHPFSGSYEGDAVIITLPVPRGACIFRLTAAGSNPSFKGTYGGTAGMFGRSACGPGTIEVGLH